MAKDDAKHEVFIDKFIECGDVKQAAEDAGFTRSHGRSLFKQHKRTIQALLEEEVIMTQAKAIGVIKDTMGEGAANPKQELKFKAAQDVLDRGGITKKQSMSYETNSIPAVMLLPAKQPPL